MAEPALRGSPAIAKALGVSARTVQRLARKGVLPAAKLGNATSPLRIERKALAAVKRRLSGEER